MQQGRQSTSYDGKLYAWLVDPLSEGMHGMVIKQIPEGSRLLDACCGTGAFAFRAAHRCREVLGIDLAPRMIDYAQRECRRRSIKHVHFKLGDVTRLENIEDRAFDYATLIMAIHEMPPKVRPNVIPELARVAGKVLIIDYASPMKWNLQGIRSRIIEAMAGPRHHFYFRDYVKRGGLPTLVQAAGVRLLDSRLVDRGNKMLCTLSAEL